MKQRRRYKRPEWANWPSEQLLSLRLCDLHLRIEETPLATRIAQLYRELENRGIRFRPFFWLSSDWFTPDGVPGTAVPFYLAHPRLAELELEQMLEVEGGTREWCMRILRHETGHALDNAYKLRRLRRRQKLFGPSSRRYPDYYTPRPYSKRYVICLEPWYAQSHPDEDFAETFAVWLTSRSSWRKRYAGWPALKKLAFVDELMEEIGRRRPVVTARRRVEPLSKLHKTLGEYYLDKRTRYRVDYPTVFDRDLRNLFSDAPEHKRNLLAATFISRIRNEVRSTVARWTGEYQYTIKQLLDDIIGRCRKLELHLVGSEQQARLDFTALLAVQTMYYISSGRHRVWL